MQLTVYLLIWSVHWKTNKHPKRTFIFSESKIHTWYSAWITTKIYCHFIENFFFFLNLYNVRTFANKQLIWTACLQIVGWLFTVADDVKPMLARKLISHIIKNTFVQHAIYICTRLSKWVSHDKKNENKNEWNINRFDAIDVTTIHCHSIFLFSFNIRTIFGQLDSMRLLNHGSMNFLANRFSNQSKRNKMKI